LHVKCDPFVAVILARLGVDSRYKGQVVGKGLLKDALLRTVQAADLAGIRAVLVHANGHGDRAAPYHDCRTRHDRSPHPCPLPLAGEGGEVSLRDVHVNDEQAKTFYENAGFESSPLDPLQLRLLMKDARKSIK
jgi:GNAT superfamily N-acetyltransferase